MRILRSISERWVKLVAGDTVDFGFDHSSVPLALIPVTAPVRRPAARD